ncbi:RnfABCDGE type electron transport complex subunit G [Alloiococcus sp. CFN-8]|uniref:RnfABCDGE type electron transport complex subunit G n=1 Tax=Alloiococcus sp. CFN-8 TaxID=3416081 RepID=UPI003CEB9254
MKENLKLGLILLMITAVAGIALGLANATTKDAIAMNSKISVEELASLLPGAESVEVYETFDEGNIVEVMEASNGDETVGYIVKVASPGFHGNIEMLVGINSEGVETGIKILTHGETPGVGSKIENADFQERFKDRPTEEEFKLVKTESSNDYEIQGITGASISSTAVVTGVNAAVKYYKSAILGEEVVEEKPGINLDKLNLSGGELTAIDSLDKELAKEVNEVKINGAIGAYIITTEVKGAQDQMTVATAIDINSNTILGIQVLEQAETPGLGDLICEDDFTGKFQGLSSADEVQVDIISGATISSEAVIEAVNNALDYYNTNINR